jgi:hypothetical protein
MITIKDDGKVLLEFLTCYTLSITALCDSLKESIRNVISSVLNVLSDPELISSNTASSSLIISYFSHIFPIIYDYFSWCSIHSEMLVKDSRKDEIIMSVNASLRAWLRNEVYSSPNDILVFYHQKYKEKLRDMPVPLQPYSLQDVHQAKKDIIRDRVSINKALYSQSASFLQNRPSSSSDSEVNGLAWNAIREELKKILIFLFGIDNPQVFETSSIDLNCKSPSVMAEEEILEMLTITTEVVHSETSFLSEGETVMVSSQAQDNEKIIKGTEVDDNKIVEEEENDENGTMLTLKSAQNYNWDLIDALNRHHHQAGGQNNNNFNFTSPKSNSGKLEPIRKPSGSSVLSDGSFDERTGSGFLSRSFHSRSQYNDGRGGKSVYGDILEILHCHIVLAASRTISAGDAFIILNDLYGGEGLLLCPTIQPRGSSKKNDHASDISIMIAAGGIKIVLKERYRLFAGAQLESYSRMSDVQPLMCFECTVTTLLLLSPELFLSTPPSSSRRERVVSNEEKAAVLLNVLVTNPDQLCRRTISIEPYLP